MEMMTELPFGYPGRVYRSPMPFGSFDREKSVLDQYHDRSVDVVVQLVSDQEALERTGRELRKVYTAQGMNVIYLPTPDFGIPTLPALTDGVEAALKEIRAGKTIVVHCNAGLGRTGLFLACLAKRGLGLGGENAIAWVRQYVPGALEQPEQVRLALDF